MKERNMLDRLLMDSKLIRKKESKQGIEKPFSSLPGVVDELEESKIVG